MLPLALVAYLLAAHIGLAYGRSWPALLLLACILAVAGVRSLRRRARVQTVFALAASTGLIWLAATGQGRQALYLPPLVLTLSLWWLFANSLQPGRVPLVTRLARLIDGELPPEVEAYTRQVTFAWALFLLGMNIELWLLALWAPAALWSLFANFLNYGLLLLFFAVEYVVRRRRFPERPHLPFLRFLRRLSRISIRDAAEGRP